MEIELAIGTRGTLKEFLESYTYSFLKVRGLNRVSYDSHSICAVNTKHGYQIIKLFDVITYVGHGKWGISNECASK